MSLILTRAMTRRHMIAAVLGGLAVAGLAACGDSSAEPVDSSDQARQPPTNEAPLDNLAKDLPALSELRNGRSETFQKYTETGRLDRIVFFADVPPGHVLNYYLDELPAIGWTEESRSELTERGGVLTYVKDELGQRLTVYVSTGRITVATSSTKLELETRQVRRG